MTFEFSDVIIWRYLLLPLMPQAKIKLASKRKSASSTIEEKDIVSIHMVEGIRSGLIHQIQLYHQWKRHEVDKSSPLYMVEGMAVYSTPIFGEDELISSSSIVYHFLLSWWVIEMPSQFYPCLVVPMIMNCEVFFLLLIRPKMKNYLKD